jgi:hypothetical protein
VALVPTLLAIGIGLALGLRWGGELGNLLDWRPPLLGLLGAGVALTVLVDLVPWRGGIITLLSLVATGLLLAFAVVNVRVGGMVLVAAGLALNLLVALVNWGTPVSRGALEASGAVTDASAPDLVLSGGRDFADGALLGFLGDAIPLPWGQVVSVGDVLLLIGLTLVTASVVRRYEVAGGLRVGSSYGRRTPGRAGRGPIGSLGGARDYRNALDALGRGPAPRRGPGLHPSRLGSRTSTRRRRSTTDLR